eukprot:PhF_6_TR2186/c0_g1_i4/m.3610
MQQQKAHFLPYVQDIPFLKMLDLPQKAFVDLTDGFHAKVYLHQETITTRSVICDRVIIVTHGNAVVADVAKTPHLKPGESIGYTCIVSHRWMHLVTAHETVECIELPVKKYIAWLKAYDVYDKVYQWTMSLLHPNVSAYHPLFVEIEPCVASQQNVRMYPVNPTMKLMHFAARMNCSKPKKPPPTDVLLPRELSDSDEELPVAAIPSSPSFVSFSFDDDLVVEGESLMLFSQLITISHNFD